MSTKTTNIVIVVIILAVIGWYFVTKYSVNKTPSATSTSTTVTTTY